jgi:hypothetical protein
LRTGAPADVIIATSIGFRPAGRGAMDWQPPSAGPDGASAIWRCSLGTTGALGLPLRPVTSALGFLPYSNSPTTTPGNSGVPRSAD